MLAIEINLRSLQKLQKVSETLIIILLNDSLAKIWSDNAIMRLTREKDVQ